MNTLLYHSFTLILNLCHFVHSTYILLVRDRGKPRTKKMTRLLYLSGVLKSQNYLQQDDQKDISGRSYYLAQHKGTITQECMRRSLENQCEAEEPGIKDKSRTKLQLTTPQFYQFCSAINEGNLETFKLVMNRWLSHCHF